VTRRSYRYSHIAPNRGAEYDLLYQRDPWLNYAWRQGQATLMKILARYCQHRPVKLLDFACGTGRIISFLEDKLDEALGVDVSESMLAVAAGKVKRARLLQVDLLENNLLEGQKFNLITAFRFFGNALRDAALRVITGLLSEGGCLVLNDHINRRSMFHAYYRLKSMVTKRRCQRTYSIRECREMLLRWHLKILRVYSVGLLHIPRYRLPQRLYHRADDLGCRWSWLSSCSESPILVCRAGF
jgi:SAM-dependent methyltransferase